MSLDKKIGMYETPLMQWFLREDGRTWHFNVSLRPPVYAIILAGCQEEEGLFFPETKSGESDLEFLNTSDDIDKAKIQCLYRLKRYMNQQIKSRRNSKRKLQDLILKSKGLL